jgi:hypothetical protein
MDGFVRQAGAGALRPGGMAKRSGYFLHVLGVTQAGMGNVSQALGFVI